MRFHSLYAKYRIKNKNEEKLMVEIKFTAWQYT